MKTKSNALCECGKPHDGWPGANGKLCQLCWEKHCSERWWEMARAFPGAVSVAKEADNG